MGLLAVGALAGRQPRARPLGGAWGSRAAWAALAAAALAAPRLGGEVEQYQAEKLRQIPRPHAVEQRAAAALDRLVGPTGA